MAEALGAAVLTVSVDDTQLRAGLLAVQTEAQRTAAIVRQAFEQAAQASQQTSSLLAPRPMQPPPVPAQSATNAAPWIKPGLPPPIPPELLRGVSGVELQSRSAAAGMDALRQSMERTQGAAPRFSDVFGGVGSTLRTVAGLAGVVGFAALAQQLISTGKESQQADIQLKALAGAYGEAEQAAAAVDRVQKLTGQSTLEAASGFTSLYAALRGTGITLNQAQVLFVGLNNAARLSGVGAQEAQAAFLQLRQGLSSGRLQGDELRSVLEQLPSLSQAIANQLGVSVIKLRNLGSEGKITTDVIYGAVRGLARQAAPGRTAVDDIGIAFKNVQVAAAKALGPALTPLLTRVGAGFALLSAFLRDNKERFELFARVTVEFGKALIPVVAGIQGVRLATLAWTAAIQAARLAQAGLLALQGPKGWLVLALGVGVAAAAFGSLKAAASGSRQAIQQAKSEYAAAQKEFEDILNGKAPDTAGQQGNPEEVKRQIGLQTDLNRLEIEGVNARADAAQQLASLEGVELARLQGKLAIQEKINERRKLEVQLADELRKPKGAGDGQGNTQNPKTIANLEDGIAKINAEIRLSTKEAEIAVRKATTEAEALNRAILETYRARSDSLRDLGRQGSAAIRGLNSPIDVLSPADAAREARRRVQAQVEGLGNGVSDASQTAERAARALRDALDRRAGGELVPVDQLVKLKADADVAAGKLTVAGIEVGRALRDGATDAAKQLRDAQGNFNDVVRGGFENFTKPFQDAQIALAQQELQPLIDRGVLRQDIPRQTTQELFAAAGLARAFQQAENQVALATNLKASADAALANSARLVENSTKMGLLADSLNTLAGKDWTVNVAVQPPQAALPGV